MKMTDTFSLDSAFIVMWLGRSGCWFDVALSGDLLSLLDEDDDEIPSTVLVADIYNKLLEQVPEKVKVQLLEVPAVAPGQSYAEWMPAVEKRIGKAFNGTPYWDAIAPCLEWLHSYYTAHNERTA